MGTLIKLITSKLAGPIASGVAVLLAIALLAVSVKAAVTEKTLRDNLDQVTDQRDAALRDFGTCRGNTDRLQAAVDRQNSALNALKTESDRKTAEAEKAASAARAASAKAASSAKAILAAKPGADMCASADALILGSLK